VRRQAVRFQPRYLRFVYEPPNNRQEALVECNGALDLPGAAFGSDGTGEITKTTVSSSSIGLPRRASEFSPAAMSCLSQIGLKADPATGGCIPSSENARLHPWAAQARGLIAAFLMVAMPRSAVP
jgi:hypothetical protein